MNVCKESQNIRCCDKDSCTRDQPSLQTVDHQMLRSHPRPASEGNSQRQLPTQALFCWDVQIDCSFHTANQARAQLSCTHDRPSAHKVAKSCGVHGKSATSESLCVTTPTVGRENGRQNRACNVTSGKSGVTSAERTLTPRHVTLHTQSLCAEEEHTDSSAPHTARTEDTTQHNTTQHNTTQHNIT